MSGNNIGKVELMTSGPSVPVWLPSLHTFNIGSNKLTMDDHCAFSSMPLLKDLNMRRNLISNSAKLCAAVRGNRFLTLLNVDDNPLPKSDSVLTTLRRTTNTSLEASPVNIPDKQRTFNERVSNLIGFDLCEVYDEDLAADTVSLTILRQVNEFLRKVVKQTKEVKALRGWRTLGSRNSDPSEVLEVRDLPPPDLVSVHCDWLKNVAEDCARHRCVIVSVQLVRSLMTLICVLRFNKRCF